MGRCKKSKHRFHGPGSKDLRKKRRLKRSQTPSLRSAKAGRSGRWRTSSPASFLTSVRGVTEHDIGVAWGRKVWRGLFHDGVSEGLPIQRIPGNDCQSDRQMRFAIAFGIEGGLYLNIHQIGVTSLGRLECVQKCIWWWGSAFKHLGFFFCAVAHRRNVTHQRDGGALSNRGNFVVL